MTGLSWFGIEVQKQILRFAKDDNQNSKRNCKNNFQNKIKNKTGFFALRWMTNSDCW